MSVGSNKFGNLFQWSSFGESHGPAMGVVIDGFPAGIEFNETLLLNNLSRRRPGQNSLVTERNEQDSPEILSGVFEGKTLGTPIAVTIKNKDQRSKDYDKIKENPRRGHADDLWFSKFGHSDHRGGGRASARETVNWVIAGSFAQMFCLSQHQNMTVDAKLMSVGPLNLFESGEIELNELLEQAKTQGESYGGVVELRIKNAPRNLGEPIFKKIKAEMTHAFMTINAVCGVELGDGFLLATQKGTEVHEEMGPSVYGGIRGGMTTGEDITFNIAFKPTSTVGDHAKEGRHDPCVVLRALPVVEAMAWNVMADQTLMARLNKA